MPPMMQSKKSLQITGMPELRRTLAKAGPLAGRALVMAGVEIMDEVIDDAKALVPVDQGTLKASGIVLPPSIQGTRAIIVGGFGGNASEYAIVVHEGRGKHKAPPPVQAIKEWCRRHGIPEGLAFPIAKRIGERGITGKKFLEKPFLARAPKMGADLAEGVRAALQSLAIK